MVIALGFAYLMPMIAISLTLLNLDTLLLNLKNEFNNIINFKTKKSNATITTLTTITSIIATILRTLSFYINWFPDSLNTTIRPLAYPLIDIFNNIAIVFILLTIGQFIIYLKAQGLKYMLKSIFLGLSFGLAITPILFLILKGVKNLTPDSILLLLVDLLNNILV